MIIFLSASSRYYDTGPVRASGYAGTTGAFGIDNLDHNYAADPTARGLRLLVDDHQEDAAFVSGIYYKSNVGVVTLRDKVSEYM